MERIEFFICVGIRAPIIPDNYDIGDFTINVSYPEKVDFGFPVPIDLLKGLSTLFIVSWDDNNGQISGQLHSTGHELHLPIYTAIDQINKLLLAFKLARVGHADGMGLRTIGIGDTLFHFSRINGVQVGTLNLGLRLYASGYPWFPGGQHPHDPHGTTAIARGNLGKETLFVARRYVRCFELLEHGYYAEAIIVSYSILDDLVQDLLEYHLESKWLNTRAERELLLRNIKESRLQIYLGPLLKVICGTTIGSGTRLTRH